MLGDLSGWGMIDLLGTSISHSGDRIMIASICIIWCIHIAHNLHQCVCVCVAL